MLSKYVFADVYVFDKWFFHAKLNLFLSVIHHYYFKATVFFFKFAFSNR